MGGGNNTGMRAADGRYFFLLNSDAWVVGDGLDRLVEFADAHPEAAVVGPRLRNVDGTLQRSVRGEPTLWRLATEYLFIRKLAPRSRRLNPLYAGGFDHDEVAEADWLFGPALLVRREAVDAVGLFDEDFFMFSEEVDWMTRFRRAGWKVLFFPGAEVVHVGGASHGGTLYVENLRGHLRWFDKHRGPREAERVRRLLLLSLRLRAAVLRRDEYREGVRFLAVGRRTDAAEEVIVYLRLAFGTLCVLAPGWAVARALGQRSVSAVLAWTMASVFVAWAAVFTLHRSIHLAVVVLALIFVGALVAHPNARTRFARRTAFAASGWPPASCSAGRSGTSRASSPATASSTRRACASSPTSTSLHLRTVDEFKDGGLHPGYAFPLWHGSLALVSWFSGVDPGIVVRHEASLLVPLAVAVDVGSRRRRLRLALGGLVARRRSRSRSSASARGTAARTRRSRCPAPRRGSCSCRRRSRSSSGRRPRGARAPSSARSRSLIRRTRSSCSCRSPHSRSLRAREWRTYAPLLGAALVPTALVLLWLRPIVNETRLARPRAGRAPARAAALRRPARGARRAPLPPRGRGLRPQRRRRRRLAAPAAARGARAATPLGGVRPRRARWRCCC